MTIVQWSTFKPQLLSKLLDAIDLIEKISSIIGIRLKTQSESKLKRI